MSPSLNAFAVSLVAIVGLVVLVALHDVTSDVAIPIIVGLTGVHIGANASNSGNSNNTPPRVLP